MVTLDIKERLCGHWVRRSYPRFPPGTSWANLQSKHKRLPLEKRYIFISPILIIKWNSRYANKLIYWVFTDGVICKQTNWLDLHIWCELCLIWQIRINHNYDKLKLGKIVLSWHCRLNGAAGVSLKRRHIMLSFLTSLRQSQSDRGKTTKISKKWIQSHSSMDIYNIIMIS